MDYRYLGHSGLQVSTITLGTMTFGGKAEYGNIGSTDVAGARRLIDIAIEHGVNLFDTANVYSTGTAEEILGKALGGRRDDVLIATKARMPMGEGPNDAGSSRYSLIRQVEASLTRLGTDHVDLYQLHNWDAKTPLEETLEALDTLVRSGKVRYVGASNFAGWQLMKALAVADQHGYERFVSQQIHYTLQAREAEYELLPITVDQNIGVLVWTPLAGGLLTGKYQRGQAWPEGTRQVTEWDEPPVRDEDALYDIVDVLTDIGDTHGVSAAQVSIAWSLGRPGIASLVIGARTEDQLRDNLAGASLTLSEEERRRLDTVSRPPLIYPYWHHAKSALDRLGPADIVAQDAVDTDRSPDE